jgi:hypothetical protein
LFLRKYIYRFFLGLRSLVQPESTVSFVVVGRGIQNYTCSGIGATPISVGAIATLYDATKIAVQNEDLLHTIPSLAVNDAPPAQGGDFTLPSPFDSVPIIGHHFFNSEGMPVFSLSAVHKIMFAERIDSIPAPSSASKGPAGTGAIAWLDLSVAPNPLNRGGLNQVYRVETAGGSAPATCASTRVISVQYAAEYWFY